MTAKERFEKWWSEWHVQIGEMMPEELNVPHTGNSKAPGGIYKLKNLMYIAFCQGFKQR